MRRLWAGLVVCALLAGVAPASAQQTQLLVITGLSGDPAYAEQFHAWATTLIDAAVERYGLAPDQVIYLAEKVEVDPDRVYARSTQEEVEAAIEVIGGRAAPNAHVFILLVGHGSYNSGESRFNLPGRDFTAKDYDRLLTTLAAQRVTFVNAATSSGGFIEALSGEGRTVVTATRSGSQWNETVFGGYFVAAFAGGGSPSRIRISTAGSRSLRRSSTPPRGSSRSTSRMVGYRPSTPCSTTTETAKGPGLQTRWPRPPTAPWRERCFLRRPTARR